MSQNNKTHNRNPHFSRKTTNRNCNSHSRSSLFFTTPHFFRFAAVLLVVSSLIMDSQASTLAPESVAPASTTTAAPVSMAEETFDMAEETFDISNKEIKIVFSDLDGTLIHYPSHDDDESGPKPRGKLLNFPKSSTGKVGVISAKTLSLVDEIRNQNKVKFVLISGMRTSTLLQRLPYLPKADAYCSENGGRIFYPIDDTADKTKKIMRSIDTDQDEDESDIFWVRPKRYKHDGNGLKGGDPKRHKPFAIREDKAWRRKMQAAMGGDSYGSFSLEDIYASRDDPATTSLPLHERDGLLWDFARDLIHNHGFVLDTKGYATCFRVNKKQQTSEEIAKTPPGEISGLLENLQWKTNDDGVVVKTETEPPVASSVNLNCVDFYPSCSGKKNCCLYLASKFFAEECQSQNHRENEGDPIDDADTVDAGEDVDAAADGSADVSFSADDFLSKHAVCMCDDDNDLEMALACQHAYLPDIASESMRETIEKFPDHFTITFSDTTMATTASEESEEEEDDEEIIVETDASDLALSMIWLKTMKADALIPVKRSILSPKKISVALCCVGLFVASSNFYLHNINNMEKTDDVKVESSWKRFRRKIKK